MWTGLILVCSLQNPSDCITASSFLAYPTEEECIDSFSDGLKFVETQYPDYVIVDGPKCYKWDYVVPNV